MSPSEEDARQRVVIIDPEPLARRVVRDALQEQPNFVVAAEAATATEGVELCRYYRPEGVILELGMGRGDDGVSVARRIAKESPETKVLAFSREDDEDLQLEALAAGASGFVSKNAPIEEVIEALASVLRGDAVLPPMTTMALIERLRVLPEGGAGMRPVRSPLTQREWEILDLMSQGMDTRQMSEALVLAEETIYSHVKNILRKLGVHSRRDAVQAAQRLRDPLAGLGRSNGDPASAGPVEPGLVERVAGRR